MAMYRHWSVSLLRPRRCPTLSNPVLWQSWMVACLGYTLQMKMLFPGWPIMYPIALYCIRSNGYFRQYVLWCSGTSSFQFARCIAASRAASVLGVNLQTLSDCIFLPDDATHSMFAIDRLENFVSELYSQLLLSLTYLMNRLVSCWVHL